MSIKWNRIKPSYTMQNVLLLDKLKTLVEDTPNNMELGKKIRSLMWEDAEDTLLSNNPDDGSWFNR